MIRRCVLGVTIALLIAGTVALAQGPGLVVRTTEPTGYEGPLASCYDAGGQHLFDIMETYVGTIDRTKRYRTNGTLAQENMRLQVTYDRLYNSADPEKFLETSGENEEVRYIYDENGNLMTQYSKGAIYKFTAPAYGTVLLETGLAIFDRRNGYELLSNVGHNDVINFYYLGDASGLETICNYLK